MCVCACVRGTDDALRGWVTVDDGCLVREGLGGGGSANGLCGRERDIHNDS